MEQAIRRIIKETRGEPGLPLNQVAQAIAVNLSYAELSVVRKELKTIARHRRGLDQFISRAVKQGALDHELAEQMSYEQKRSYFSKSEVESND